MIDDELKTVGATSVSDKDSVACRQSRNLQYDSFYFNLCCCSSLCWLQSSGHNIHTRTRARRISKRATACSCLSKCPVVERITQYATLFTKCYWIERQAIARWCYTALSEFAILRNLNRTCHSSVWTHRDVAVNVSSPELIQYSPRVYSVSTVESGRKRPCPPSRYIFQIIRALRK